MHAARLDRSPRLQRVHELLSDGAEHSTLEILQEAGVCAVNSIVAELRHAGAEIECRQSVSGTGQRVWLYRMRRPAGAECAGCGRRLSFLCPFTGLCSDCEQAEGEGHSTSGGGEGAERSEGTEHASNAARGTSAPAEVSTARAGDPSDEAGPCVLSSIPPRDG